MTEENDQRPGNQPSAARAPGGTPSAMKQPLGGDGDRTDGRARWEWQSRYPTEAQRQIRGEAIILVSMLVIALLGTLLFLGFDGQAITCRLFGLKFFISLKLLAVFFAGAVGGIAFSLKWLFHAVAKGWWHQDRCLWRLLVPVLGGIYACVVMTLWSSSLLPNDPPQTLGSLAITAALAFLVGYFADGVSGLLTNIAKRLFGTVARH